MKFAQVAVDTPAGLIRTFSYSIPPSLDVLTGQTVIVPFGPNKVQGVVFGVSSNSPVPNTRDIIRVESEDTILTESQLSLAKWVSEYYISTLFQAAALMMPPGGRMRITTYLSSSPDSDTDMDHHLTPFQQKVFRYIDARVRVSEERMVAALGENSRSTVAALVKKRLVVRSRSPSGKRLGPKIQEILRLSQAAIDTPKTDRRTVLLRSPQRLALMKHLESSDLIHATAARKEYGASAVNGLLQKGWIIKDRVQVERDPLTRLSLSHTPPTILSADQNRVSMAVKSVLEKQSTGSKVFLLEGVTGSGKTEIYLDAVRQCMNLGKGSIVLVPEIALTHQTVERFASRFPGKVAVLHSGLTPGERFDQWWKIRRGEYGVVVGSRSAVFAPHPNLGMIVVDEEHEWTYKQHDSNPRYHARKVAEKLAEITNSTVVLGSASPDLGSYRKALVGRYELLHLPNRIATESSGSHTPKTTSLAASELVDMRAELRDGHTGIFSRSLSRAIGDCIHDESQIILFLNRRGTATSIQCRHCGLGLKCKRCNVPLTYHRDNQLLVCHYCGRKRKPPERCPQCLRHKMTLRGFGTQAVVDELTNLFPGTKVLRWDRDAVTSQSSHESLLEEFRSGKAQVLVGTQMIAKGLHFPSVTLVGVILADIGLHLPNYLAGERSFQLLSQVAGRAGRSLSHGRAIIQTYQPENYAIEAASRQDYRGFYDKEIAYRHEQGNPPYSQLIQIQYSHTNPSKAEGEALQLSNHLRRERDSWGYFDIEVLGPTPAYPTRTKGRYRWQITLRGKNPRTLLDRCSMPQGWSADVDPIGLI